MSAGETAVKTVSGGFIGALKGAALAIGGCAAVAGIGGLVAGLLLGGGLLAAGLCAAGIIGGGIFGFMFAAPLFSFIGGTWRAAKEARRGTERSALEQQQQYEQTREALLAQRQSLINRGADYGNDAGVRKSYAEAVEQERLRNISANRQV